MRQPAGVFAGIVLVLAWLLAGVAPVRAAAPALGAPAPEFSLVTLDGKNVSLASFRGRTVVVNVWGSWCPPCRLEMDDFSAEARAAGPSVAFLGIDTTESAAIVRAYAAAKDVAYPQAVTASDSAFVRDYDIRAYPTTFVVDAQGIVRARHADNLLSRAQLHAFIDAAKRGQNAPLESLEQRKLDALLDPARYPVSGDAVTVAAGVRASAKAIEAAEAEMDDAMTDPSRDHDLLRTRDEENVLRDRAIGALAGIAHGDADLAMLARLRGDAFAAAGRWPEAAGAYADALKLAPADRAALGGAAEAAAAQGDAADASELLVQIAKAAPTYASWIAVTRSEAKRGDRDAAYAALDRAVALAESDAPAHIAWTHLYGGRAAVQLGDTGRARIEFAQAAAAAQKIPPGDPRYAWYLEQAQEATVALDLDAGATPALSLAPWTGPDLPGSIASTVKYRLAVSGPAGTRVALVAAGLPKSWIGSFCSDTICAPFRSSVVIPPGGVKIVEVQVVPGEGREASPTVRVEASAGGRALAPVSADVAFPHAH